jgi:hypothetical protein
MLEKLINQFSAFLPAFEFMPTLARFIFLLPTRFSRTCIHRRKMKRLHRNNIFYKLFTVFKDLLAF